MNKKAMQAITEALRDAPTAYSVLEQIEPARAGQREIEQHAQSG